MNHISHNLKHIAAALRLENNSPHRKDLLRLLDQTVSNYDANIHSGNEVLDVLLTNTCVSCNQHHVQWTCLADGSALAFVDPVDLYVLLGNATENALESVKAITEADKRFISINI